MSCCKKNRLDEATRGSFSASDLRGATLHVNERPTKSSPSEKSVKKACCCAQP